MCELFALALHKSTRTDLYPLKAKKVYYLEDLDNFFGGLTVFLMKNGTQELLLCTEEVAFQPKGLMFIKATKDPWMRHVSRKTKHRYFAKPGAESMFDKDRPEDACSSTLECVNKRLLWVWEQGVGIHQELAEDGVLHKDQLMQFIRAKLSR